MRIGACSGFAIAGMLALSASTIAENRVFIIANHADGYGVDRCLATGERCGVTVAPAYCQSRSFALVKAFRKIERDAITGAVPETSTSACGGSCENFVAI